MRPGLWLSAALFGRATVSAKDPDLVKLPPPRTTRGAPLDLVYVADHSRMQGASADDITRYTAADAGFVAQNVYLFCASSGLNRVVRGSVDRAAPGTVLGLGAHQQVVFAQAVGYLK